MLMYRQRNNEKKIQQTYNLMRLNVDKDMRLQNLDLVTNTWIFWYQ